MTSANQKLPTLLLATIAGWSLIVLICVYAGLGGRYSLHPDDASRVPELPRLDLSRAQNPLKPLAEYAMVGERPLFNADRRPLPVAEDPNAANAEGTQVLVPLDVVVTSIIINGDMKIAILQDNKSKKTQSVRMGASIEGEQSGWKLVELGPRKATFEGPSGRNEVELRVFDGSGGESPTAVASAAEAAPQDAAAAAVAADPQSPEARAELIRKRIEERRRQMREEAERANKQNDG